MKSFVTLLFLCLVHLFSFGQNQRLDALNGFMGYRLGMPVDSMPGKIVGVGKYQKLDRYRPEPEMTQYEGIPVFTVHLNFFRGKLHTLVIKLEGDKNSEAFLEEVEKAIGPGDAADALKTQFHWKGSTASLMYRKSMMQGVGEFMFVCHSVHNDYEMFLYEKKRGK